MIQFAPWIAAAISRYHSSEHSSALEEKSCSVPQKLQMAKQLMNVNSKYGLSSGRAFIRYANPNFFSTSTGGPSKLVSATLPT